MNTRISDWIINITIDSLGMEQEQSATRLHQEIHRSDELIERLKKEYTALAASVDVLKAKDPTSPLLYQPPTDPEIQSPGTKQKAMEIKAKLQLEKELENTMVRLKQLNVQLKQEAKKVKRDEIGSVNDLVGIQSMIRTKDQDIATVTKEVKTLTIQKRKQEKQLLNKDTQIQAQSKKMGKLADDIHGLREMLLRMEDLGVKKSQELERKQEQVKDLQSKYLEISRKNGEKPVTFEQFKLNKKEKMKKETLTVKTQNKKPYVTIKELISSHEAYDNIQPTKQNLLDLKKKRQIASSALKNARKKHQNEIAELSQRLSQLKEQNQTMKQRLKEKEKEKKAVESHFSDTKRLYVRMNPIDSLDRK